ncbi:MAG: D-alanyl-D-alanine carboxypeptidase [Chromatiaceae bacterium]|nr:D-alanyl-D-alanine carboxypeptidase [Chromatiaceae bacterium]MCP5423054.1 D-alanyl-D-alanine carboxypeptidase [Chromatiaceae bacterium]
MQNSVVSLFLCLILIAAAAAQNAPPEPPTVAATGYLLIDLDSDMVLAAKDSDQRLEPASLTKIMTAYVVFHELQSGSVKLGDEVLVSEKAWKAPGSRMFIEVNKRVTVEDLLKGMIIQSGNDASIALAEHVAGSEEAFANLMNDYARRLGMDNTHFVNATGLPDPDHYTTPHDIVRVTEATIREFPEFYKLYSVKEFTFNDIRQHNRNNLLWRDDSVDGVKTGHTENAGFCLVASAKRENMRLVSVVMGTASEKARLSESQSLLNYGFRFFETHRLYGAKDNLTRTRVWMGEDEQVSLGLAKDLFVTIPRRQYDKLNARTEIQPLIEAPLAKGQKVGDVIVELDGQEVLRRPLVALADVAEGGLWRKAVDSVLMMLE